MQDKPRVRRIGSLVNQLLSRRGYAQIVASEEMHRVIANSVGTQLSSAIHVGNLKGGVLHVYANDSVTLQELSFRKQAILRELRKEMPDNRVTDLRFRIQPS